MSATAQYWYFEVHETLLTILAWYALACAVALGVAFLIFGLGGRDDGE